MYVGQPVPTTLENLGGGKISDGKSIRVAVPESTVIEQGKFYLLDGFLGCAVQSVTTGVGETSEVVLNIEIAEFETDQIVTDDAFAKGDKCYWDATNKKFTTVATTGSLAGVVTVAKDTNNVIWFILVAQQPAFKQAATQADSTAADVAGVVADFNALLAKLKAAELMASE